MQVLMLSDVYFPRVNGVSTSIQSFRNGLRQHGVDVHLIAPDYGSVPAAEDREWVTRLESRVVPFDPEDRFAPPSRYFNAGQFRVPAIIHVQTPFAAHYGGLRLARWQRVPVVATYHTLFEEYLHHYLPGVPAGLTRALARRFSRTQCNALDAVIVPSSAMEDRLRSYGVVVPIHVLPTGISTRQFAAGDRTGFRQRLGISAAQPLALFVGRIAHEKNIGFLVRAALRCRDARPDLRWVIAGEGPALPALREQVRGLGLDEIVRFVGYLDRDTELRDCYAAADLFAFASKTETQGLVLLEAMAMGVPVVALSVMGTVDVVGPQRGAVTPPEETNAFADAICRLAGDPWRRLEMGREARRYAGEWTEELASARLAALYRQIRTLGVPGRRDR